jgi:rubredoxin
LILTDSIATFECEVVDKFDVGTHIIFIGQVVEAELLDESKDPLTYAYYRDVKKGLAPKNAPTYIDKEKLKDKDKEVTKEEQKDMGGNFICTICAYVYDPKLGDDTRGIPAGTSFEDLPDDWVCPVCAAAKSFFISEN